MHPHHDILSFNNDKLGFTGKFKQLCYAKEDAYRSGNKILYNQATLLILAKDAELNQTRDRLFVNSALPLLLNHCA